MIKTIFISRLMKIYLIFILFGLNACDFNPISSEFRNKISESNQGNIVIGVVGSSDTQNLFVEGVKLAIQEINKNGGIYNQFITPLFYDEKGSLNELYYDQKKVHIPILAYFIIPSSTVGMAMFQNNELDIIGDALLPVLSNEINRIINSPHESEIYYQEPSFCTSAYAFNTRLSPVNHPKFRQAISMAINRKLIVKSVTCGNQQTATTFTRPPIFGAVLPGENIGIHFTPYDAKAKLMEAGFTSEENLPVLRLAYLENTISKKVAIAIKAFVNEYLNVKNEL